jgi:hypothetical protein
MNKQLQDLYEELLSKYTLPTQEPPAAFPFLLYIDDEEAFEDKDVVKVMFFGQEFSGKDWYHYDYRKSVCDNMELYQTFFKSITGSKNKRGLGNGMNILIERISKKFPNKSFRFVWNDIVKLYKTGEDDIISPQYYNTVGKEFAKDIIRGELDIIKPDIIIFLSGPTYDDKLQDIFGDILFETLPDYKREDKTGDWERRDEKWGDFPEKALAKVHLSDFPDVRFAFRSYHPAAHKNHYPYYFTIRDEINL